MPFISYAQNQEDVLLWRALGRIPPGEGFYIDVGASDPVEHSVTKAFHDAGWRGINIEPLPAPIAAFAQARPHDINLALAAGSHAGSLILYDVPAVRGWASLDPGVADRYRAQGYAIAELTVPVRTLAAVCRDHVTGPIHFLKIDVEGTEGAVLRGMDFSRWRPWVLVIEATLPNSRSSSHAGWEALVLGQGYRFAWFDGLNRYYVAEEQAGLLVHFTVPPNVFDDYLSCHLARAWEGMRRAEDALRDKEGQLDNALGQVARLTKETAAAQHMLARARADTARAQAGMALGEAKMARAQARIVQARRVAGRFQAVAAEVRADLVQAQERMAGMQAGMAEARADMSRMQASMVETQAGVACLHGELDRAMAGGQQVAHWAHDLEQRLLATLSSTSWKVTQPLRAAGTLVRRLRRPGLLGRALRRARTSPRLRRTLVPLMLRHPWLGKRVTQLLQATSQAPAILSFPASASTSITASEEELALPASVRTVLADLRHARNTP